MNKRRILLIFIIIISVFLHNAGVKSSVNYLNVGQGDSSVIYLNDMLIVIDGGEYDYVNTKLSRYIPLGREIIDHLVITHQHTDHFLGIYHIIKYYKVKNLYIPRLCNTDSLYTDLINNILREGSSIFYTNILLIDKNGVSVLDSAKECSKEYRNINNSSVIVVLDYNNKYIFMGDSEKEKEFEILNKYKALIKDIDYLKVGHHCSKTSSSVEFINIANPKFSICSYGEGNRFGHPSEEILQRLSNKGSKILHTIDGDINIMID